MKKITIYMAVVAIFTMSSPHAMAHGDIATSDPADGANLKKVPNEVSVTFSETPAADSRFVVKDGCGDVIGDPSVEEKSIVVAVADAQPGTWSVKWNVLSAEDGHQTEGAISFKVKGEPDCSGDVEESPADDIGDAAPPVDNPDSDGGGLPTVVIIGGLIGVVLVALAIVVRRSGAGSN